MFVQPLFALFVLEDVNCFILDTGNSLSTEERGIPLGQLLVSPRHHSSNAKRAVRAGE